jgi:hypothetical protein
MSCRLCGETGQPCCEKQQCDASGLCLLGQCRNRTTLYLAAAGAVALILLVLFLLLAGSREPRILLR